jgi:hypothetical protein
MPALHLRLVMHRGSFAQPEFGAGGMHITVTGVCPTHLPQYGA